MFLAVSALEFADAQTDKQRIQVLREFCAQLGRTNNRPGMPPGVTWRDFDDPMDALLSAPSIVSHAILTSINDLDGEQLLHEYHRAEGRKVMRVPIRNCMSGMVTRRREVAATQVANDAPESVRLFGQHMTMEQVQDKLRADPEEFNTLGWPTRKNLVDLLLSKSAPPLVEKGLLWLTREASLVVDLAAAHMDRRVLDNPEGLPDHVALLSLVYLAAKGRPPWKRSTRPCTRST